MNEMANFVFCALGKGPVDLLASQILLANRTRFLGSSKHSNKLVAMFTRQPNAPSEGRGPLRDQCPNRRSRLSTFPNSQTLEQYGSVTLEGNHVNLLLKLLIVGVVVGTLGCGKSESTEDSSTDPGGGGGVACSGKVMFVTAVSSGNFGGASGADTLCMGNRPTGHTSATFKAYLGDDGAREACDLGANSTCNSNTTGRTDWPLAASTLYCNLAGTTIGTTSAAATMTSAIGYVDSAHSYKYFTGMNNAYGVSNSNNCTDFSSTGGASSTAGLTNGGFGGGTTLSCASAGYILCVEQ